MGALLMNMASFHMTSFQSTQIISEGILKKMAISFGENALRVADFLNRHSQFENRSLVDFEIGNERKSHKIAYI